MANLTSPGSGSFLSTPTASVLDIGSTVITVNTFIVFSGQNVAVPNQIVISGGGNDSATVYDSTGTNQLNASGSTATLTTMSLRSVTINKFGSISAVDQNGQSDAVHKAAIDFALSTTGAWASD